MKEGDWVKRAGEAGRVEFIGTTSAKEPYAYVKFLTGRGKAFFMEDLVLLSDEERAVAIARAAFGLQ